MRILILGYATQRNAIVLTKVTACVCGYVYVCVCVCGGGGGACVCVARCASRGTEYEFYLQHTSLGMKTRAQLVQNTRQYGRSAHVQSMRAVIPRSRSDPPHACTSGTMLDNTSS